MWDSKEYSCLSENYKYSETSLNQTKNKTESSINRTTCINKVPKQDFFLRAVTVVMDGRWISNYLFNQCLSPLMLWVRSPLRWGVLDKILCDQICQLLVTGRWFSQGTPVSSTNKTDGHNITEILLKVMLTTINQTKPAYIFFYFFINRYIRKLS